MLYSIVYNLCDNAIKYNMPNGKVEISVLDLESGTEIKVLFPKKADTNL